MADYFEELGHEPTGPNGPDDFQKHFNRLRALAIMHGIDIEMQVPEASQRAIKKLPSHVLTAEDMDTEEEEIECSICKMPGEVGDTYKVLPCKHEFHEECVLLWLKKVRFLSKSISNLQLCFFLRQILVLCAVMNLKRMMKLTKS